MWVPIPTLPSRSLLAVVVIVTRRILMYVYHLLLLILIVVKLHSDDLESFHQIPIILIEMAMGLGVNHK